MRTASSASWTWRLGRVGFGIDGHRPDAHLPAGPDHPDGDLAAVGDQDLAEHAVGLLLFRPLRLSFFEEGGHAFLALRARPAGRRSSPRCSAWPRRSPSRGPAGGAPCSLGQRLGPGGEERGRRAPSTFASSSPGSTTMLTRPISRARRASNRSPVRKYCRARLSPDPAQDVGGDARPGRGRS